MAVVIRHKIPLSLLIVRYFAYTLALVAAAWLVSFMAFSAALNVGAVYPSSWGAANIEKTAAEVEANPAYDWSELPTAYRYVEFSPEGGVVASDISDESMLERARSLAADYVGRSGVEVSGMEGSTYAVFDAGRGTVCVLASAYLPEFVSPGLRAALPNPQSLLVAAGCASSVAAVVLVARRASRVLTRKMSPLVDASRAIGRQDLGFEVGSSNVHQIDDVLRAFDTMRAELAASLEAQWRAEQARRDEIAALAHDLKTPLTVVRTNAEYIIEEASRLGEGAPFDAPALGDVIAAAADASTGAERLDACVSLLIEASCGETPAEKKTRLPLTDLAARIEQEAEALARTEGIRLETSRKGCDDAFLEANADMMARAAMNAVSNAFDHARESVRLSFRAESAFAAIEVEDDGEGFTPESLDRGCERFYCGSASRTGAHHGLGLFIASETARAHGGSVTLSNREGDGAPSGGRVVIRIPLVGNSFSSGLESNCG